jgi:hypothetical protein
MASVSIFRFCALGFIFGGTEVVDSFSTVPRALGPVFMF